MTFALSRLDKNLEKPSKNDIISDIVQISLDPYPPWADSGKVT